MQLTEALLSDAAGWDVMKRARAYLEQGQVLSSYWAPPLLRGVVQAGEISFRASMVIKGPIDIENLCTCRDAREWGKICAHGVAVGLHYLKTQQSGGPSAGERTASSPRPSPPRDEREKSSGRSSSGSGLRIEEGGEPAELRILFPPNLEQAVARGKVMLVFEAKWSGGRCPLNALPKGRAYAFSEKDKAIVERIEMFANSETPAVLQLSVEELSTLLPLMSGHEGLSVGRNKDVAVEQTPIDLPLKATLEPNGEITLVLRGNGGNLTRVGDWIWRDYRFQRVAPALASALTGAARIPRTQVPQFLSQQWTQLGACGEVEANFKLEDFTLEPQAPQFHLELKGGLAQLNGLLQCSYGARIMTVGVTGTSESVWLPDPEKVTRYSTRDLEAEQAALARLQRHGFTRPDANGRLSLVGQNAVLNFFAREFPKLQREWKVSLEEKLERSTSEKIERIQPQFHISSGVQWFDLDVVFASASGETFPPSEIQRLLRSGQSHTRLKNGKVAIIDTGAVEELQEVLLDASPQQQEGGYRISNTQAGFVESTLRGNPQWKVTAPTAWRERSARLSGEAKLECPELGELESVLRPYQKHGVAWLSFLRENGFGGILADEMGLGKTLQTLAFLNTLPRPSATSKKPHLVICPTSLVFNWVAEAKTFTPELKVLALHGTERHAQFQAVTENDLVVTSYALIRRDMERYRGIEFDTVVLDEAQHIKNRQTQNAQAVKTIRSAHRLVLTGTPLENSVLDLWSIFDFLMPGYLGTAQDFRERYEIPITRDKNVEAQSRLARRLKPFLLRRLKRDVAADLPAKLDQVSFCELTPDQRTVYQQVIEASRKEILEASTEQEMAKTRMMVLTALLRLRQICCDLRLLNANAPAVGKGSGKVELFAELLEEIIDGGHRVLVFSQFTSMLALLREQMEKESISFCYLDGSTPNRGAVVQRFQTDASVPVFLISLKAGGVGLNLTAADTVIHFDPWWNPAVEDQATDRAHRIGQSKVVTSYKLIARDTIEEKILLLQNRKREIIRATLEGEEEFASSLTMDEMRELLG